MKKIFFIAIVISLIPLQGILSAEGSGASYSGSAITLSLSTSTPAVGITFANIYFPFTKIDIKGDIIRDIGITQFVVKLNNMEDDGAFDSLSLVDVDNNCSIGSAQNLSDGISTFDENFVIPAGQTRSIYLSGNTADSLELYDNATPLLSLESIKISGSAATIVSFPISGNYQLLNSSITQEPETQHIYGLEFDPPPLCPIEELPEPPPPPPDPKDLKLYGVTQTKILGNLVKLGDSSTVYLVEDEERFSFPNQKIYESWFGNDFSNVEIISLESLSSYPLVGNVHYKPGSVVKIPTDPKVYLVTDDGGLRWVPTIEVLEGIGLSLNQLEDLPEVFFVDYTIGYDIHIFAWVTTL